MTPFMDVCIRSFKENSGFQRPPIPAQEFDAYAKSLLTSIRSFREHPNVGKVFVLTNGDPQSSFSESVFPDGSTPTSRLVLQAFPNSNVTVIIARTWGENRGSGVPIMDIVKRSYTRHASRLLIVSKEIQISHTLLSRAFQLAIKGDLDALGFYRERWWEKPQWQVPQNTCCLWDVEILREFGFDSRCDGDGTTLELDGQCVPIAGMEDFHTLLRILKAHWNDLRWGMIGTQNPLAWDVSHKNETEKRFHEMKLSRQAEVMLHYVSEIFPDNPLEAMAHFYASRLCAV